MGPSVQQHGPTPQPGEEVPGRVLQAEDRGAVGGVEVQQALGCRVHAPKHQDAGEPNMAECDE